MRERTSLYEWFLDYWCGVFSQGERRCLEYELYIRYKSMDVTRDVSPWSVD